MDWEIENIKESIIGSNVRFTSKEIKIKEILPLRRKYISVTQMGWVTLRAVADPYCNTLYNPKALILIFKN